MKCISIRVRNSRVMHDYRESNAEVVDEINDEVFTEKMIAIERIQSVSERCILVSSSRLVEEHLPEVTEVSCPVPHRHEN